MKKKMSFRHALSVHFRAAKALHGSTTASSRQRRSTPLSSKSDSAYVAMFTLKRRSWKELALLRRPDVLRNWVIAGVLCTGLCAVAKAVLFQRTETLLDDLYGRKGVIFCRKFFSMDYVDMDKQETRPAGADRPERELVQALA